MREIHSFVNSNTDYSDYTGTKYTFTSGYGRKFDLVRPDVVRNPIDAHGWRQPSPYHTTLDRFSGPFGSWQTGGNFTPVWWQRNGNLRYAYGQDIEPTASLPSAGQRSRALVGALLKLKDQKVNLAQAFAERQQTARLFSTNITKMAQSVRKLRRGDFRGAAVALGILSNPGKPRGKDVPSRWLELQYGWKPLLSDIVGSCVELSGIDLSRYIVTVEEVVKEEVEERIRSPEWGFAFAPIGHHIKSLTGVHVRLDYTPDNVILTEFASLGLTNPLLIAWELMPWSFVVDWAIPVGNWISALDAAAGYNFKGGSMTQFGRKRIRYLSDSNTASPTYYSRSVGITGSSNSLRSGRTVYEFSPIPSLPRLKNPWSYGHVANATALLATAMGRT